MINNITYIIIFTILAIIIIYSLWIVSKYNRDSFIFKFTEKLFSIPSIFIPVGIFLTFKVFKLQIESMERESTFKMVDRSFHTVNKSVAENYDKCPNLINSLYFDWQKNKMTTHYSSNSNNNSNKDDDWTASLLVATLMFQAWEDSLTSYEIDETGAIVWFAVFMPWAYSDKLKDIWEISKSNYAKVTADYGDFLFYTIRAYTPKNDNELYLLAQYCVESNTFKKIIETRYA